MTEFLLTYFMTGWFVTSLGQVYYQDDNVPTSKYLTFVATWPALLLVILRDVYKNFKGK